MRKIFPIMGFGIVILALLACSVLALDTPVDPTATPTRVTATVIKIEPTASATPNPTATPVVVSPTPTEINRYVVKAGDTLGNIAVMFGMPMGYLADQNKIKDPNLIYPGQVIVRPPWPPLPDTSGKQIIVILSTQQVFVYEKGILLKTFLVSTGVKEYRTITGHFNIYEKLLSTTMDGPGYHLPKVPYTMYFYQDYGLHGTYWHHNFGHPMSHGCVNLYTPDAEWLFNWADVGTPVWVMP